MKKKICVSRVLYNNKLSKPFRWRSRNVYNLCTQNYLPLHIRNANLFSFSFFEEQLVSVAQLLESVL